MIWIIYGLLVVIALLAAMAWGLYCDWQEAKSDVKFWSNKWEAATRERGEQEELAERYGKHLDGRVSQVRELEAEKEVLIRQRDEAQEKLKLLRGVGDDLLGKLDEQLKSAIAEHGTSSLLLPYPKVHATKKQMKKLVTDIVRGAIVDEVTRAILAAVGPDDTIDGRLIPDGPSSIGGVEWLEDGEVGVPVHGT